MLSTPQLHHIPSQYQQVLILRETNPYQLLKYPNLSKLKIHPPIDEPFVLFSSLCKSLKTLQSLKTLDLDCSGQGLNDKNIKELSLGLRGLHGLTNISLNFKHNYGINGESLTELLKIIKKKRSVKRLWIDFSGCGKISYEHLASIYASLSEMKPLRSFHINYSEVSMQCKGSKELFENSLMKLGKLRLLEGLLLNFKMLQINNEKNLNALSHNISRMKKLSKVSLDFANSSGLKPMEFESLIHSMKSCSKLQKLHLNFPQFSSNNFAPQDLFDLISNTFENSPNLSHLLLNFSYNQITGSQTQKMLLTLQALPNLSALDLNFSFCPNLDNKTLDFLSEGIINLKNLTSLKINFFQCSLINAQGLMTFSNALKNLTSLQVFELCLTSNRIRGGLPSLFQALYHLRSLYQLSLKFCDCQEILDGDLEALAEVLSCLKGLKYLDLSLRFCVLITHIGLKNLAFGLQSLQCLEIMRLNCFECRKIAREGVDYFKSHLARLKLLREVCLEFPKNLFNHQPQQQFFCQSRCSIF